jgi:hypothetical protein
MSYDILLRFRFILTTVLYQTTSVQIEEIYDANLHNLSMPMGTQDLSM